MSFEDFYVYGRHFYVNCTDGETRVMSFLAVRDSIEPINFRIFYLTLREDSFAEVVSPLKRVKKQF